MSHGIGATDEHKLVDSDGNPVEVAGPVGQKALATINRDDNVVLLRIESLLEQILNRLQEIK